MDKPSLFGLHNSNRNFTSPLNWGKNQFNSSFPVSLGCYMSHIGLKLIYLVLNDSLQVTHTKINTAELFGIAPDSPDLFFGFENNFIPYQKMVTGTLPRVDLVTYNSMSNSSLRALEIKLTALPDNATCHLSDEKYSCEIVVRPDTIVYLALNIASAYHQNKQFLLETTAPICQTIQSWDNEQEILAALPGLVDLLEKLIIAGLSYQQPLILQPVWKTVGKSRQLHENCLDIFIWSDLAFTRLFVDQYKKMPNIKAINRPTRTIIWLVKMLYDFASDKMSPATTTGRLLYGTRNDKAFSVNGVITHPYMTCPELTRLRVTKSAIKHIILNGGEKFLSPERRFDAIIVNTPGLFNQ